MMVYAVNAQTLSRVYTRYMQQDTSIQDEKLVSIYMSTDTVLSCVLFADTSGYM